MTDTMPEQTEDWSDVENSADTVYPEMPSNPHNHVYTISMDGRGPMIVVRGNTPAEVNERFQALMDGGVTTIAASVYSHMKAEMGVAQGLGPVSPAPAGPPAPPQGAPVPPPFGPNVSVPQAPGYAGPPQAPQFGMTPQASAAPQWGGQSQAGGQAPRNGPKPRPAWQQVYQINVPIQQKEAFKAYREENKDVFKGKVMWAGGGNYWIHGDIVQSFAPFNPTPA